ncbi:MAG: bifunctional DNA-formamidopyrimidine glycosylase/DNA-(apurinic or apyrimidinic site) lyase [Dehalococcoidia bacterium]|jgi:formamidopyrimidine-DNA glycosylase|nr:bifunctional DNA-formamidopyrimidine glycosylase/DNA-(apurinic or apyrimidinic site) lyase [Dehalococcoidia bacterium]MDP6782342.1 bifunctional DNA-formamidopyrimidine glycosylase/DNA-(apurinic or apyrimidinic site) lyase [Dehalococcoidia bacterium]
MPELPEVETIKSDLTPVVEGHRFVEVEVLNPGSIRHPSPEGFRRGVEGQGVRHLGRRGKYLIIHLEHGDLVVHLMMTGGIFLSSHPTTRATFLLDDGTRLHFADRRKLGGLWLVADAALVVGKLGPEPLEPDFTPRVLGERLRGRKAPIKALLLDQSFLAGVGNMYADEALYAAGVHPLRPGCDLSSKEVESIHGAVRKVLLDGIKTGGASVDTYRRPDGSQGHTHRGFQVAHRRGEMCPRCGTPLQRLAVRQRGTYFCPSCQNE